MSATQNWSRCSRQTSRSICRHSRARLDRQRGCGRDRSSRSCATARPTASRRRAGVGLAVGGESRAAACRRARRASCDRAASDEARRPSRAASRRAAWRSRRARAGPAPPCGRRVRARRRWAASSTAPCCRRRRRSGRSVLRAPETRATRRAMPSRSTRIGAAARRRRRPPAAAAVRRASSPWARGSNGGRAAGLQRDQVRARGAREAEARTARCRRPGRTCAPTGSTGTCPSGSNAGAVVAELGLRDERAGLVGRRRSSLIAQCRGLGPERVGEPRAVGRPREVLGAPVRRCGR